MHSKQGYQADGLTLLEATAAYNLRPQLTACIFAAAMPTISSSGRASLRRHLIENFSQTELEELAFDMGLDTETLARDTKSEFARALILHFEDRGDMNRLTQEVLARRPDALLEQNLSPTEPAVPSAMTDSSVRPITLTLRVVVAVILAIVTLATAILLTLRWKGDTAQPTVQPSTAAPKATASIASDLPGTPLGLNTAVRSGLDDKLKPRDVWRIELQAQQTYKIEIHSSVQDGLGLGILLSSASKVPDSVETTNRNICSNATNCDELFTPSVSGAYFIVVYGMRPNVSYELIARER